MLPWRSPFEQSTLLQRVARWGLEAGAGLARRLGLRVQARMNIDPRSCWHDPVFVARCGAAALTIKGLEWTDAADSVRRDMILLLADRVQRRQVEGAVAEVGVRHGMTAALLLAALPDRPVVLVDTFEGFTVRDLEREPAASGQIVGHAFPPEKSKVVAFLDGLSGRQDVEVFACDVAGLLAKGPREQSYALVHIDVDLERPTAAALAFFGPRMTPGGYIVVHDYNAWPGAHTATEAFIASGLVKAVVPMPDKSGSIVLAF